MEKLEEIVSNLTKDTFMNLDEYIHALLKYEEYQGDSPNEIDELRDIQKIFYNVFKNT